MLDGGWWKIYLIYWNVRNYIYDPFTNFREFQSIEELRQLPHVLFRERHDSLLKNTTHSQLKCGGGCSVMFLPTGSKIPRGGIVGFCSEFHRDIQWPHPQKRWLLVMTDAVSGHSNESFSDNDVFFLGGWLVGWSTPPPKHHPRRQFLSCWWFRNQAFDNQFPWRIHGTGIFTYIYHKKSTIHVGKQTIVPWILRRFWGLKLSPISAEVKGFGRDSWASTTKDLRLETERLDFCVENGKWE